MDTKDFLIEICNEAGVSGYEADVGLIIKREFSKYCDDVYSDKLGNIIGHRKGAGNFSVMYAAHMDEIGLIISYIEDSGLLKFSSVGGYDQRTLIGQEVIVHAKENIFGVIGMKPPHLIGKNETENSMQIYDMAIDTGYSYEKLKTLVKAGDLVTIKRRALELENGLLSGKAMDDRAGVASMFECMKNLNDYRHDADCYYVATVQEELGARGALVGAYALKPDIAIAVDVGFAELPGLKEYEVIKMNGGAAIHVGPNIHPKVASGLKKAAVDNYLAYQWQVLPGRSGTDAMSMQIAGDGTATGVLSIPLKYMHTSVETISLKDIKLCGKLMSSFVLSLNGCDMEAMLCL